MNTSRPFLPVILGTDINTYGMARSFHEAYGLRSLALGRSRQYATSDSAILDVDVYPNFDTDPAFRDQIAGIGRELSRRGLPLLLVPCSDTYVELVSKNRELLEPYFLFNCVSEDLRQKLENKQDFYRSCAEHGLPYPATVVVNKESFRTVELPFDFPVAVKADDSIAYFHLHFADKKKAYQAADRAELMLILETVYEAGYGGDMILQDFIPGGMETMYVLNAYVDQTGQVRMTCTARCALDECLPADIGNYNALLTGDYPAIDAQCKSYLEKINYRGFANFDLKFDHRDGQYKVFELNLRQGRSSFYATAAGNNLAAWLAADLLGEGAAKYVRNTEEHLWLNVAKKVLLDYAPSELKPELKRMLKAKKVSYTLDYARDQSVRRRLSLLRRKLSTLRYYPRFCGKGK
ncbi:MAG: hypothetical protein ACOX3P_03275 [Saccharofermentanales bacterium]|jgi:D-aspartate ligase|nr:hypothetical protein [Bacillota bacterium]